MMEYGNKALESICDDIVKKYPHVSKYELYMQALRFPDVCKWPGGLIGSKQHLEFIQRWIDGKNKSS